jgi:hypothetical protein
VNACVRKRLPNRRIHEAIEFEHNGFVYIGGLGRSREGRLAEVFFARLPVRLLLVSPAAKWKPLILSATLCGGSR